MLMNQTLSAPSVTPTKVRYGVLGFACSLSMITYLDRVCFGTVAPHIQSEFGLTETQKGMLFSAFALAYAAFEVPSGWLGNMFGARKTLIRIVLWWSFFTVLTGMIYPIAAMPMFAFAAMLVVRFLFGMGEAGAYPNIAHAFHSWFPYTERGSAKGAVWMAGRFAGGITGVIVLALLYETVVGGVTIVHWRHTFWIFGVLGVIWCGLFWWWFRDRPEDKSGVNQAEIDLIRHGETHSTAKGGVPWKRLFGSTNLWVLCLMYFCASYGWYFNITYLPGYLQDFFGMSRGAKWSPQFWEFSLMQGMPLLFGSVACLVGGLLTDRFIRRTGNRKWGRRLFGVIGHGVCALCYFLSIYANSAWMFVLAIAMAAFWNDMTMGSAWASCLDIGKRYSGIVAGCMNTVGNLGGFAAGFLTGYIIDLHRAPAVQQPAVPIASMMGNLAGGNSLAVLQNSVMVKHELLSLAKEGWAVNFFIFGCVYVVATLLWLRFDATKPVVAD